MSPGTSESSRAGDEGQPPGTEGIAPGTEGIAPGRRRRRRRKHGDGSQELFTGQESQGQPPALPDVSQPPREQVRGERQQGQQQAGQKRHHDREGGRQGQQPEGSRNKHPRGPSGQRQQDPGQRGQQQPDGQKRRHDESGRPPRKERHDSHDQRHGGGERGRFPQRGSPVVTRGPLPEGQQIFGAGDDDIELPPGIAGFDAEGRPIFSRHARQSTRKASSPVRALESLSPSAASLLALARLDEAIDEAAPLQPKYRAALRGDIRKLWEDLTSDKEHRPNDYLGSPASLSAYLRYFLPWNVYRLSSILSNADFCLPDKAVIVDIGSGPLTFVIALWMARPELREVPLTIYCVDRVERVMEIGLSIFETLCMRLGFALPPWKIELKKEAFGAPLPERAHLLTAANVFNEFFWKDKASIGERAIETTRTLLSYLRENGSLFVMEPGDPRSGSFITALRAGLIAEGASPLGPCPHAYSCPFPGIFRHLLPPEQQQRPTKGDPNVAPPRYHLHPVTMPKKRDKFPWCHFGIDTDRAPGWLKERSEEAGLPKERAVLSYLWAARGVLSRPLAGPAPESHPTERERRARAGNHGILVRVVSEPFALSDGGIGQYGCSNLGYSLLRRSHDSDPFEPGDLLEVQASPLQRNDEKSGAIILPT
jgi:hypothetical protein